MNVIIEDGKISNIQEIKIIKETYGIIRDKNNYTVHKVKVGEIGTLQWNYFIIMDNGIEVRFVGNDFEDPDEQFKEHCVSI